METWCPQWALSCREARAPWKSPPTLLWEPGSRVFCSLDVDLVPWSEPPHVLLVVFAATIRTGTGRGPSSSSSLAAAAAPECHPDPRQGGGWRSVTSYLPLLRGGSQALGLRFPGGCFCPDAHLQPQAASTPTLSGRRLWWLRPWTFLDPPLDGLEGINASTGTRALGSRVPGPAALPVSAGSQTQKEAEHVGRSWL